MATAESEVRVQEPEHEGQGTDFKKRIDKLRDQQSGGLRRSARFKKLLNVHVLMRDKAHYTFGVSLPVLYWPEFLKFR